MELPSAGLKKASPYLMKSLTPIIIFFALQLSGLQALALEPRDEVFHPLTPGNLQLQRAVKQAFDPHGIFKRLRIKQHEVR